MRAYEEAIAKEDAFDPLFEALHKQRNAAIEAIPVKRLPADPYTGRSGGDLLPGERQWHIRRARSTIRDWEAGRVRVIDDIRKEYDDHLAVCREVIAIDAEREAAVAAVDARLNYREAEARYEALGEARYAAECTLLCDTPSPDLSALLWKLEQLQSSCRSLDDWQEVMEDARRLMG